MSTGCPQCDEIQKKTSGLLCLDHRLALAEWQVMSAMNTVEEIKKQIEREKEDVSTSTE